MHHNIPTLAIADHYAVIAKSKMDRNHKTNTSVQAILTGLTRSLFLGDVS